MQSHLHVLITNCTVFYCFYDEGSTKDDVVVATIICDITITVVDMMI